MHKFNPEHTARLLSGRRLREMKPRQFLLREGLGRGDVFVDVGCGPGFFSLPAARIVGKHGVVYAVDTEPAMLAELQRRNPPENVRCIESSENSVPLSDGVADFLLLAYVLHEAEDKGKFLKELRRLMKKGAKLIVLDWKKKHEEEGPPYEDRLTMKDVRALLTGAGFSRIRGGSINPSHYGVSAIRT